MRAGDPRLGGAPRARGAARLLIGGQVTLCLVLVVCALLLATTMRNLRHVDIGFTPERVLTQSLQTPASGPAAAARRAEFWIRVLDQMRELPGARVAALSTLTPMSGRDTGSLLGGAVVAGRQAPERRVRVNHVSEGYLEVFGIQVLEGRGLDLADRTAHVAVINRTTQAELFRVGTPSARRWNSSGGRATGSSASSRTPGTRACANAACAWSTCRSGSRSIRWAASPSRWRRSRRR